HRDDGEENIDDADHAAPRLIEPGTPRPFALAGRAGAVVRTALRSVAERARGLRASSSSPAFSALRTGAQRDASVAEAGRCRDCGPAVLAASKKRLTIRSSSE